MIVFSSETATEGWVNAFYSVTGLIDHLPVMSRVGETKEVMKCGFSISHPRNRWVICRQPMISPAFAIAEVFWILSGSNQASFINKWNPLLQKYAGNVDKYYGAYGQRLKENFGFDQIEKAYEALSHNPLSRQVVIQIWDPNLDMPKSNGHPNAEDIPCNLNAMLKIRNNKLEWTQIMRSNDLFRGTPYNIIQFTTLQEIMAGWLGVEVGEFVLFTDSLHVYGKDLEHFTLDNTWEKWSVSDYYMCTEQPYDLEKKQLMFNQDSLLFSKEAYDLFFPKCLDLLEKLVNEEISDVYVKKLANCNIIPQAYKNLLSIPMAYLALKSNKYELMHKIETICLNKTLLYIWNTWKKDRGYEGK